MCAHARVSNKQLISRLSILLTSSGHKSIVTNEELWWGRHFHFSLNIQSLICKSEFSKPLFKLTRTTKSCSYNKHTKYNIVTIHGHISVFHDFIDLIDNLLSGPDVIYHFISFIYLFIHFIRKRDHPSWRMRSKSAILATRGRKSKKFTSK